MAAVVLPAAVPAAAAAVAGALVCVSTEAIWIQGSGANQGSSFGDLGRNGRHGATYILPL